MALLLKVTRAFIILQRWKQKYFGTLKSTENLRWLRFFRGVSFSIFSLVGLGQALFCPLSLLAFPNLIADFFCQVSNRKEFCRRKIGCGKLFSFVNNDPSYVDTTEVIQHVFSGWVMLITLAILSLWSSIVVPSMYNGARACLFLSRAVLVGLFSVFVIFPYYLVKSLVLTMFVAFPYNLFKIVVYLLREVVIGLITLFVVFPYYLVKFVVSLLRAVVVGLVTVFVVFPYYLVKLVVYLLKAVVVGLITLFVVFPYYLIKFLVLTMFVAFPYYLAKFMVSLLRAVVDGLITVFVVFPYYLVKSLVCFLWVCLVDSVMLPIDLIATLVCGVHDTLMLITMILTGLCSIITALFLLPLRFIYIVLWLAIKVIHIAHYWLATLIMLPTHTIQHLLSSYVPSQDHVIRKDASESRDGILMLRASDFIHHHVKQNLRAVIQYEYEGAIVTIFCDNIAMHQLLVAMALWYVHHPTVQLYTAAMSPAIPLAAVQGVLRSLVRIITTCREASTLVKSSNTSHAVSLISSSRLETAISGVRFPIGFSVGRHIFPIQSIFQCVGSVFGEGLTAHSRTPTLYLHPSIFSMGGSSLKVVLSPVMASLKKIQSSVGVVSQSLGAQSESQLAIPVPCGKAHSLHSCTPRCRVNAVMSGFRTIYPARYSMSQSVPSPATCTHRTAISVPCGKAHSLQQCTPRCRVNAAISGLRLYDVSPSLIPMAVNRTASPDACEESPAITDRMPRDEDESSRNVRAIQSTQVGVSTEPTSLTSPGHNDAALAVLPSTPRLLSDSSSSSSGVTQGLDLVAEPINIPGRKNMAVGVDEGLHSSNRESAAPHLSEASTSDIGTTAPGAVLDAPVTALGQTNVPDFFRRSSLLVALCHFSTRRPQIPLTVGSGWMVSPVLTLRRAAMSLGVQAIGQNCTCKKWFTHRWVSDQVARMRTGQQSSQDDAEIGSDNDSDFNAIASSRTSNVAESSGVKNYINLTSSSAAKSKNTSESGTSNSSSITMRISSSNSKPRSIPMSNSAIQSSDVSSPSTSNGITERNDIAVTNRSTSTETPCCIPEPNRTAKPKTFTMSKSSCTVKSSSKPESGTTNKSSIDLEVSRACVSGGITSSTCTANTCSKSESGTTDKSSSALGASRVSLPGAITTSSCTAKTCSKPESAITGKSRSVLGASRARMPGGITTSSCKAKTCNKPEFSTTHKSSTTLGASRASLIDAITKSSCTEKTCSKPAFGMTEKSSSAVKASRSSLTGAITTSSCTAKTCSKPSSGITDKSSSAPGASSVCLTGAITTSSCTEKTCSKPASCITDKSSSTVEASRVCLTGAITTSSCTAKTCSKPTSSITDKSTSAVAASRASLTGAITTSSCTAKTCSKAASGITDKSSSAVEASRVCLPGAITTSTCKAKTCSKPESGTTGNSSSAPGTSRVCLTGAITTSTCKAKTCSKPEPSSTASSSSTLKASKVCLPDSITTSGCTAERKVSSSITESSKMSKSKNTTQCNSNPKPSNTKETSSAKLGARGALARRCLAARIPLKYVSNWKFVPRQGYSIDIFGSGCVVSSSKKMKFDIKRGRYGNNNTDIEKNSGEDQAVVARNISIEIGLTNGNDQDLNPPAAKLKVLSANIDIESCEDQMRPSGSLQVNEQTAETVTESTSPRHKEKPQVSHDSKIAVDVWSWREPSSEFHTHTEDDLLVTLQNNTELTKASSTTPQLYPESSTGKKGGKKTKSKTKVKSSSKEKPWEGLSFQLLTSQLEGFTFRDDSTNCKKASEWRTDTAADTLDRNIFTLIRSDSKSPKGSNNRKSAASSHTLQTDSTSGDNEMRCSGRRVKDLKDHPVKIKQTEPLKYSSVSKICKLCSTQGPKQGKSTTVGCSLCRLIKQNQSASNGIGTSECDQKVNVQSTTGKNSKSPMKASPDDPWSVRINFNQNLPITSVCLKEGREIEKQLCSLLEEQCKTVQQSQTRAPSEDAVIDMINSRVQSLLEKFSPSGIEDKAWFQKAKQEESSLKAQSCDSEKKDDFFIEDKQSKTQKTKIKSNAESTKEDHGLSMQNKVFSDVQLYEASKSSAAKTLDHCAASSIDNASLANEVAKNSQVHSTSDKQDALFVSFDFSALMRGAQTNKDQIARYYSGSEGTLEHSDNEEEQELLVGKHGQKLKTMRRRNVTSLQEDEKLMSKSRTSMDPSKSKRDILPTAYLSSQTNCSSSDAPMSSSNRLEEEQKYLVADNTDSANKAGKSEVDSREKSSENVRFDTSTFGNKSDYSNQSFNTSTFGNKMVNKEITSFKREDNPELDQEGDLTVRTEGQVNVPRQGKGKGGFTNKEPSSEALAFGNKSLVVTSSSYVASEELVDNSAVRIHQDVTRVVDNICASSPGTFKTGNESANKYTFPELDDSADENVPVDQGTEEICHSKSDVTRREVIPSDVGKSCKIITGYTFPELDDITNYNAPEIETDLEVLQDINSDKYAFPTLDDDPEDSVPADQDGARLTLLKKEEIETPTLSGAKSSSSLQDEHAGASAASDVLAISDLQNLSNGREYFAVQQPYRDVRVADDHMSTGTMPVQRKDDASLPYDFTVAGKPGLSYGFQDTTQKAYKPSDVERKATPTTSLVDDKNKGTYSRPAICLERMGCDGCANPLAQGLSSGTARRMHQTSAQQCSSGPFSGLSHQPSAAGAFSQQTLDDEDQLMPCEDRSASQYHDIFLNQVSMNTDNSDFVADKSKLDARWERFMNKAQNNISSFFAQGHSTCVSPQSSMQKSGFGTNTGQTFKPNTIASFFAPQNQQKFGVQGPCFLGAVNNSTASFFQQKEEPMTCDHQENVQQQSFFGQSPAHNIMSSYTAPSFTQHPSTNNNLCLSFQQNTLASLFAQHKTCDGNTGMEQQSIFNTGLDTKPSNITSFLMGNQALPGSDSLVQNINNSVYNTEPNSIKSFLAQQAKASTDTVLSLGQQSIGNKGENASPCITAPLFGQATCGRSSNEFSSTVQGLKPCVGQASASQEHTTNTVENHSPCVTPFFFAQQQTLNNSKTTSSQQLCVGETDQNATPDISTQVFRQEKEQVPSNSQLTAQQRNEPQTIASFFAQQACVDQGNVQPQKTNLSSNDDFKPFAADFKDIIADVKEKGAAVRAWKKKVVGKNGKVMLPILRSYRHLATVPYSNIRLKEMKLEEAEALKLEKIEEMKMNRLKGIDPNTLKIDLVTSSGSVQSEAPQGNKHTTSGQKENDQIRNTDRLDDHPEMNLSQDQSNTQASQAQDIQNSQGNVLKQDRTLESFSFRREDHPEIFNTAQNIVSPSMQMSSQSDEDAQNQGVLENQLVSQVSNFKFVLSDSPAVSTSDAAVSAVSSDDDVTSTTLKPLPAGGRSAQDNHLTFEFDEDHDPEAAEKVNQAIIEEVKKRMSAQGLTNKEKDQRDSFAAHEAKQPSASQNENKSTIAHDESRTNVTACSVVDYADRCLSNLKESPGYHGLLRQQTVESPSANSKPPTRYKLHDYTTLSGQTDSDNVDDVGDSMAPLSPALASHCNQFLTQSDASITSSGSDENLTTSMDALRLRANNAMSDVALISVVSPGEDPLRNQEDAALSLRGSLDGAVRNVSEERQKEEKQQASSSDDEENDSTRAVDADSRINYSTMDLETVQILADLDELIGDKQIKENVKQGEAQPVLEGVINEVDVIDTALSMEEESKLLQLDEEDEEEEEDNVSQEIWRNTLAVLQDIRQQTPVVSNAVQIAGNIQTNLAGCDLSGSDNNDQHRRKRVHWSSNKDEDAKKEPSAVDEKKQKPLRKGILKKPAPGEGHVSGCGEKKKQKKKTTFLLPQSSEEESTAPTPLLTSTLDSQWSTDGFKPLRTQPFNLSADERKEQRRLRFEEDERRRTIAKEQNTTVERMSYTPASNPFQPRISPEERQELRRQRFEEDERKALKSNKGLECEIKGFLKKERKRTDEEKRRGLQEGDSYEQEEVEDNRADVRIFLRNSAERRREKREKQECRRGVPFRLKRGKHRNID